MENEIKLEHYNKKSHVKKYKTIIAILLVSLMIIVTSFAYYAIEKDFFLVGAKYTNETCIIGTFESFQVNNNEQIFTPKCSGKYLIEAWGASGGDTSNSTGGKGAYTVGSINLNENQNLYLMVGTSGNNLTECGIDNNSTGGGKSSCQNNTYYSTASGGATYVATISKKGLANYSDNSSNLLMVAAGGGGAISSINESDGISGNGGNAGGYIGNAGTVNGGGGATQTTGNAFGLGCNPNSSYTENMQVAGGAGLYGGSCGTLSGGGGGSSYLNSSLNNAKMYCLDCTENDGTTNSTELTISTTGDNILLNKTNCPLGYSDTAISKCAKVGNGQIKITYLGE